MLKQDGTKIANLAEYNMLINYVKCLLLAQKSFNFPKTHWRYQGIRTKAKVKKTELKKHFILGLVNFFFAAINCASCL